jgi:hypothetical protein
MVGGLKFLRRLLAAPALAKHVIAENLPGPSVQSDDELHDYAPSNGSTVYHASCSCMMGNHGMAVVDDQLRVRGLEALRVVDASVMPAVSSTNTNAPTIMIAEKGAATLALHSGSHATRRWRGTDSNFRFPERSAKRQGRARGEITDPLSSFVSLPYGYPATACVGIKPEKPKPPA